MDIESITKMGYYFVLVMGATQGGISICGAIILKDLHIKTHKIGVEKFTEWAIPLAISIVSCISALGLIVDGILTLRLLVLPLILITVNIFFTTLMILRILRYINTIYRF